MFCAKVHDLRQAVAETGGRGGPQRRVKSFTSARVFSAQNGFERRANAMAEKPTKTPVPAAVTQRGRVEGLWTERFQNI